MPSRRKIKKQIKERTNNLIEDAFIELINGDKKEEKKMDAIIDQIIDDRNNLLNKISGYPNNGSRAEIKAFFKDLKDDLSKKGIDYDKKIGHVG